MAPVYKLKYFDFMGVAEPIRYLMVYGGSPYENVVINHGVEWNSIKKTTPFGKLPVLTIDDKVLFQSVAISRYLGKVLGLVPTDDYLAAELDALASTVFDFGTRVHDWYHETNVEKKTLWYQDLSEDVIPTTLKDFESWVQKKGGYLGGKKLTWVDFYFVGVMESIQGMWDYELLQKKYPNLYQLHEYIHSLPAIKTYVNTRPSYKY